MTFNSSAFSYNGRKYSFSAILSWSNTDPGLSRALDISHIDSFYYSSEMNSLLLRGYLEYTDTNGLVDIVLDKQFAYLEIQFYEMEVKSDNAVTVEYPSDTVRLQHKFYIASVEVLDRSSNQIRYRFNLVSRHWFNCTSKLSYSNYAGAPQDVVDIFRSLLTQVGVQPDPDTFDRVNTGVKLHYIAGVNDTCMTAASYLMQKLYYYRDRADHLVFFSYNEHKDMVEMFDSLNRKTWYTQSVIPVTFFKNQIENLASSEPVNLATVVRCPRTQMHNMVHNTKMYGFDCATGDIYDVLIGSETIRRDYVNSIFKKPKFEYIENVAGLYKQVSQNLNFSRASSYWNNENTGLEVELYDEMVNSFCNSNSLVVNTAGTILRKPGSLVEITIDRDVKNATGDDHKDMEQFKNQYKAYEGRWFVTRVQSFLDLRQYRYTQNLVCSRNFMKT